MSRKRDHSVNLGALETKLNAVRQALGALSPTELQALTANPDLLRRTFVTPRKTNLAGSEKTLKAYLAKADSPVRVTTPPVQVSKEQGKEIRRLQIEIWKKHGIADEMLALAKIRGVRIDPFAGQDPEPASKEEE